LSECACARRSARWAGDKLKAGMEGVCLTVRHRSGAKAAYYPLKEGYSRKFHGKE